MGNVRLTDEIVGRFVGGRFRQTYDRGEELHSGEIRFIELHSILGAGSHLRLRLATTQHVSQNGMLMPFANYVRETALWLRKYDVEQDLDDMLVLRGGKQCITLYPASHTDGDDLERWFAMPSALSS